MRSDFSYKGDNVEKNGVYMIWPEFEDAKGRVITDVNYPIPVKGTARMFIVNPKMRSDIHCKRARVGTECFFMIGSRKIAKAKIIEIVDLYSNPKQ